MSHVQIEITIPIDVRQSQRTGGASRVEARYFAQLKPAAAIIEEQTRAGLNPVNEQIFIAVVVHVGKDRTGTHLILVGNAARLACGTKTKVSLVQIQSVAPLNIAEVNVGQIISVNVTNGHTCAIVSNHILVKLQPGKVVYKLNSAHSREDQLKAFGSRCRRLHCRTLGQWAAAWLGDNRHTTQRKQKNNANCAWPSAAIGSADLYRVSHLCRLSMPNRAAKLHLIPTIHARVLYDKEGLQPLFAFETIHLPGRSR